MGAITHAQEIRQRRTRRMKLRKQRARELKQLLQRGRTHQDRVKIAKEFRAKAGAGSRA